MHSRLDFYQLIVIASFTDPANDKPRTHKLLRLNPELLNSKDLKKSFLMEYSKQIQSIPAGWDPHKILEFHKCAMRSVYIDANKKF